MSECIHGDECLYCGHGQQMWNTQAQQQVMLANEMMYSNASQQQVAQQTWSNQVEVDAKVKEAREQGRMAGLEEAAKACDIEKLKALAAIEATRPTSLCDCQLELEAGRKNGAIYCADAIRKLAEKSGGGDG